MICGTFALSNIPNGQEQAVYDGYSQNQPPPQSVTKVQADDGTWTVTATWAPCPAGTTATHDAQNAAA